MSYETHKLKSTKRKPRPGRALSNRDRFIKELPPVQGGASHHGIAPEPFAKLNKYIKDLNDETHQVWWFYDAYHNPSNHSRGNSRAVIYHIVPGGYMVRRLWYNYAGTWEMSGTGTLQRGPRYELIKKKGGRL